MSAETTLAQTLQQRIETADQITHQTASEAIVNRLQGQPRTFAEPLDLPTIDGLFSVTFTGFDEAGALVSDQESDTDDFVTYELDELPVESLIQILALLES